GWHTEVDRRAALAVVDAIPERGDRVVPDRSDTCRVDGRAHVAACTRSEPTESSIAAFHRPSPPGGRAAGHAGDRYPVRPLPRRLSFYVTARQSAQGLYPNRPGQGKAAEYPGRYPVRQRYLSDDRYDLCRQAAPVYAAA